MANDKKSSAKDECGCKDCAEGKEDTVDFEYTIREMSNGDIKVIPLTEGATEQDVYQHIEDMANNIRYQRQAVAMVPYVTKAAEDAAKEAVTLFLNVMQASQNKNEGN